jgi:hypothetical protein
MTFEVQQQRFNDLFKIRVLDRLQWDAEFALDQKTSAETVSARQQCLYFLPLPQLQRSFLPSLVFSVADRWGMFPAPLARALNDTNTWGISF